MADGTQQFWWCLFLQHKYKRTHIIEHGQHYFTWSCCKLTTTLMFDRTNGWCHNSMRFSCFLMFTSCSRMGNVVFTTAKFFATFIPLFIARLLLLRWLSGHKITPMQTWGNIMRKACSSNIKPNVYCWNLYLRAQHILHFSKCAAQTKCQTEMQLPR